MAQDERDLRLRLLEIQVEMLGNQLGRRNDEIRAELAILGIQFDGLSATTINNDDRLNRLEESIANILRRLEKLENGNTDN